MGFGIQKVLFPSLERVVFRTSTKTNEELAEMYQGGPLMPRFRDEEDRPQAIIRHNSPEVEVPVEIGMLAEPTAVQSEAGWRHLHIRSRRGRG